MATSDIEQPSDSTARTQAFPGYTIDALRAEGKAAEARAEFERLIQEGVESGIDPRTPAAILDAVRGEVCDRSAVQAGKAR